MTRQLTGFALVIVAATSGLIVLVGYFTRLPVIVELRSLILGWAVILSAIALIVGIINLIGVHLGKIKNNSPDRFYSLVTIVSLLLTFVIVVFYGLASSQSVWIFRNILAPIETSMIAVLSVTLIYGLAKIVSREISLGKLIFILTAFFILASSALLTWGPVPLVGDMRDWLQQVWALAGVRAILIGVALGAIAAGLRILVGADRPYEG